MDFDQHRHNWPMAELSRFVLSKPHLWHVQEAGQGPLIVLIHGAGGATQSWRHLFPLLVQDFRVVAFDLPGQGFTKLGAQDRCGLTTMADDILALFAQEGWEPDAIVGHSAGAAIGLEIAGRKVFPDAKIIGLNAALKNFEGVSGVLFPLAARALSNLPFVADIFSGSIAMKGNVDRLIAQTGSHLGSLDLAFYEALFSDRTHVNNTLRMMAQWNLDGVLEKISDVQNEVALMVGTADRMVAPGVSKDVLPKLERGCLQEFEGLGHLAHEEDAIRVFKAILHELQ